MFRKTSLNEEVIVITFLYIIKIIIIIAGKKLSINLYSY